MKTVKTLSLGLLALAMLGPRVSPPRDPNLGRLRASLKHSNLCLWATLHAARKRSVSFLAVVAMVLKAWHRCLHSRI